MTDTVLDLSVRNADADTAVITAVGDIDQATVRTTITVSQVPPAS